MSALFDEIAALIRRKSPADFARELRNEKYGARVKTGVGLRTASQGAIDR